MQPAREEYRQLARDLSWHADCFGVSLSGADLRDVTVMLTSLECADRLVDEIPAAIRRRTFADAVLRRLGTGEGDVPDELRASLDPLRAALLARGTLPEFVDLTRSAFDVAEAVRDASDRRAYIEAVHEEGRLTPAMTLCLLPADLPPPFVAFFRRLGDTGNFVDELVDVRGDHRRGDRRLRPGLRVHAHLAWRLGRGAYGAARTHPRPVRLLAWGLGYLWRPALDRLSAPFRIRHRSSAPP